MFFPSSDWKLHFDGCHCAQLFFHKPNTGCGRVIIFIYIFFFLGGGCWSTGVGSTCCGVTGNVFTGCWSGHFCHVSEHGRVMESQAQQGVAASCSAWPLLAVRGRFLQGVALLAEVMLQHEMGIEPKRKKSLLIKSWSNAVLLFLLACCFQDDGFTDLNLLGSVGGGGGGALMNGMPGGFGGMNRPLQNPVASTANGVPPGMVCWDHFSLGFGKLWYKQPFHRWQVLLIVLDEGYQW